MNGSSSTRPTFGDVWTGARFLFRLTRLLRERVTPEEARAELRGRLERREENFLGTVRDGIYAVDASPYRRLLELAGCEYGDVERLVRREGLEGALGLLYRKGVYLTADESKGRRAVVRGSAAFEITAGQLDNPRMAGDMIAQTGGSRGTRARVPIDLSSVRDHALEIALDIDMRGGQDWLRATWGVPGSSILGIIIRLLLCGAPPDRWFSLVDPAAPGLHPRYKWSERALRWSALLAGTPLPRPRHVPLSDPLPIARWMAAVLRDGQTPCLRGFVSSGVRVCQAAFAEGIDLRGAQFEIAGEPMTAARLAAIHRVGAEAAVFYGSTEGGNLGRSCMAREEPDDMHFRTERLALIQPGEDASEALPPRALLMTSLLPSARLVLLNASLGDQAEVVRRDCGCPLEAFGLTTHLHTIRSFEKLTAGGMTFFDADVVRVLEDVLPGRFGGGPTDYQLVDEEAEDGRPRVRLLVNPRLGPVDEAQVRQVFLGAVGPGDGPDRVMALVWRDAGLPIVERQIPAATPSGKIQHIHRGAR